jgi:hypothetical protein
MDYGSGDVPEEVYSPDPSLASSSSKLADPRLIHVEGSEFADYKRCFCGRVVAVFHAGRKAPKKYRYVRCARCPDSYRKWLWEEDAIKKIIFKGKEREGQRRQQMITKEEGQNLESV